MLKLPINEEDMEKAHSKVVQRRRLAAAEAASARAAPKTTWLPKKKKNVVTHCRNINRRGLRRNKKKKVDQFLLLLLFSAVNFINYIHSLVLIERHTHTLINTLIFRRHGTTNINGFSLLFSLRLCINKKNKAISKGNCLLFFLNWPGQICE